MLDESRGEVMLPRLDGLIAALRALAHRHAVAADARRAPTASRPRRPRSARRSPTSCTGCGARAPRIEAVPLAGQDERRGGQLQRARASPTRISTGRPSARASSRARAWSSTPTPRRSSRTTASPSCSTPTRARTPSLLDLDRDLWGYISLGYFRQKTEGGRGRLLDHAAQGQPDRLREFRRQPRRRQRAAAPPRGQAAGVALAARPVGLHGAAQRRRRARPHAARATRPACAASASSRPIPRAWPRTWRPTGKCWPRRCRR